MSERLKWTDEQIKRLRELWASGLAASKIAAAFGVRKNAIVGKVHRLDLPRRGSPIVKVTPDLAARNAEIIRLRRLGMTEAEIAAQMGVGGGVVKHACRADPTLRQDQQPRRRSATLPPLSTGAAEAGAAAPRQAASPGKAGRAASSDRFRAERGADVSRPPRTAAPSTAATYGRVIPCCWPIGSPRTKAFRFCEAPSKPGKPYCADHYGKAYEKLKRVEEPDVALPA